jgi:hypothetical protein
MMKRKDTRVRILYDSAEHTNKFKSSILSIFYVVGYARPLSGLITSGNAYTGPYADLENKSLLFKDQVLIM